jgi:tetratricopeptide (TPR) repeat protein
VHLVATSRLTGWDDDAVALGLDVFDADTATRFLIGKRRTTADEREAAGSLARALAQSTWLPHALAAIPHAQSFCPYARPTMLLHGYLGDLRQTRGETSAALDSYRQAVEVAQRLADADPHNAAQQRDLSVSLNKLGDIHVAHGQLQDALNVYAQSRDIAQRLAGADRFNAGWQRDLFMSHFNLARIQLRSDALEDAQRSFTTAKTLIADLVARLPDHPQYQRDLEELDALLAGLPTP